MQLFGADWLEHLCSKKKEKKKLKLLGADWLEHLHSKCFFA